MKHILMKIGWIMFALLTVSQAIATTYYVRNDGNDYNSGLENSAIGAWQTIQYAVDQAIPGDLILVQAGTYPEEVVINTQGLSDAWITLRGEGEVLISSIKFPGSNEFSVRVAYFYNIDNLIFDGNLGSAFGIWMYGADSINISGSTFSDYYSTQLWGAVGLRIVNNAWSGCRNITVRNSVFERNQYAVATPGSGMLENSLFEKNEFYNNDYGFYASNWGTRYTTFSQCLFEGNGTAIQLEGVYWYWLKTNNNLIYRSIFSNNQTGILLGEEAGGAYNGCAYANSVINSTFYANAGAGILVNTNFTRSNSPSAEWLDAQGQTFVNNIFLENGTYGIDNNVNQTLFTGYNLAYGNGIAAANNVTFDASNNSLLEDPELKDPALGDFRLNSGSICIDTGDPAYDNDPFLVGQHIDIGALEYDTQSPPEIVTDLISMVEDIPESFLKNVNNSLPLSKKLYVVLNEVTAADAETDPKKQEHLYHSALQKLTNDILPKTDGCALTGTPDQNDWILDCSTQAEFYGPIVSLIEMLQQM